MRTKTDPAKPGTDTTIVRITLAIRIESEANLQGASYGHRMGKARRTKTQRSIMYTMIQQKLRDAGARPADLLADNTGPLITLTRIAPRPLDDDNLARALKAIRDGVADAFKTNDSAKSKLRWGYGQEKGPPKKYAVRIEIQTNGESREGRRS